MPNSTLPWNSIAVVKMRLGLDINQLINGACPCTDIMKRERKTENIDSCEIRYADVILGEDLRWKVFFFKQLFCCR